jgi:hypothetical protein
MSLWILMNSLTKYAHAILYYWNLTLFCADERKDLEPNFQGCPPEQSEPASADNGETSSLSRPSAYYERL